MKGAVLAAAILSQIPMAWAATPEQTPIIVVQKHSGFVAPQAAFELKCTIYPKLVKVERRTGENMQTVASKVKRTLFTDALKDSTDVQASIKDHAGKPMQLRGGPTTDQGTVSYIGMVEDAGKVDKVSIYVRQGLTQLEMANEDARRALTVFADINCAL